MVLFVPQSYYYIRGYVEVRRLPVPSIKDPLSDGNCFSLDLEINFHLIYNTPQLVGDPPTAMPIIWNRVTLNSSKEGEGGGGGELLASC
jgi:hypothetical protein